MTTEVVRNDWMVHDIKRRDNGALHADSIRYESWDAEAKRIEKLKKGGHH